MTGADGVTPLKLVIMSATLRVEDFAANARLFPRAAARRARARAAVPHHRPLCAPHRAARLRGRGLRQGAVLSLFGEVTISLQAVS